MQDTRLDFTFDLVARDFVLARVAASGAERSYTLQLNFWSATVAFAIVFAPLALLGFGSYALLLALLAAPIAFWLVPWWWRRRLRRTLQHRSRSPQVEAQFGIYSLSLGPSGISVKGPLGDSVVPWPQVTGVISGPEHLVLETPSEPVVLPLRVVPYPPEVLTLVQRYQPNVRLGNA